MAKATTRVGSTRHIIKAQCVRKQRARSIRESSNSPFRYYPFHAAALPRCRNTRSHHLSVPSPSHSLCWFPYFPHRVLSIWLHYALGRGCWRHSIKILAVQNMNGRNIICRYIINRDALSSRAHFAPTPLMEHIVICGVCATHNPNYTNTWSWNGIRMCCLRLNI